MTAVPTLSGIVADVSRQANPTSGADELYVGYGAGVTGSVLLNHKTLPERPAPGLGDRTKLGLLAQPTSQRVGGKVEFIN